VASLITMLIKTENFSEAGEQKMVNVVKTISEYFAVSNQVANHLSDHTQHIEFSNSQFKQELKKRTR